MASSGIKRHEIKFQSKCIDAKRFAYDLIKYSALKFNVPETSISKWKGPENDYGCSDFQLVLFKIIYGYQVAERYRWHRVFNCGHELNKHELHGELLQYIINAYEVHPEMPIILEIKFSLSIASEYVIFLYSKKLHLDLKQMAENWFDYFRLKKISFETAGGLDKLYSEGIRPEYKVDDAFIDKFISVHCLPYEESAKNLNLRKLHEEIYADYLAKILERVTPKGWKETDDIFVREYSREGSIKGYEIIMLPVTSEPSRIYTLLNMIALIPNLDEWVRTEGALVIDAALSKLFPEASSQDRAPYPTVLSSQRKRENKSSLSASVEQGLGQLSLDSASKSLLNAPTPSKNLPRTSQEKAKKQLSSQEKAKKQLSSQEKTGKVKNEQLP